jgi:ParB family chromosome partitioning protein
VGQLAITIGRPRPYIVHSLRLLTLPTEIQDLVERGALSAGQARPLVSLGNRAMQLKAARQIIENKMTARESERLARKLKSGKSVNDENQTNQVASKSADTKHFERQVSEVIGTPFSLENGRAIIDYSGNLDVLQGIVERLGYRGS